jgi:hypothetical protein
MRIIAIWHNSVGALTAFNDALRTAETLVSVVADSQMPHSLWAFYRVTSEEHETLRRIPRLTWK